MIDPNSTPCFSGRDVAGVSRGAERAGVRDYSRSAALRGSCSGTGENQLLFVSKVAVVGFT